MKRTHAPTSRVARLLALLLLADVGAFGLNLWVAAATVVGDAVASRRQVGAVVLNCAFAASAVAATRWLHRRIVLAVVAVGTFWFALMQSASAARIAAYGDGDSALLALSWAAAALFAATSVTAIVGLARRSPGRSAPLRVP